MKLFDKFKKIIVKSSAIILFIFSSIICYVDMVISPQYNMVYSQYNQSVFYIIGKLMNIGKVPYVDFIDHKGPYLYLFHALAEVFNFNKHIGLYILGVILLFITSYFMYKTFLIIINIIDNKKENGFFDYIISIISSIYIMIILSSYKISFSTLQCETFVAPLLSIAIYLYINDIYLYDKINDKTVLIFGILFSIILFLKPNYNLFFLSILIILLIDIIKNKKDDLFKSYLKNGIIGLFIGALPIIISSIIYNNFKQMINYYFILNMKYSSAPYAGTDTKMESFLITLNEYKFFLILLLISALLIFTIKNKKIKRFLLSSLLTLILATLMSLRPYTYYLIVLVPYLGIGLLLITKYIFILLNKINNKFIINGLKTLFIIILSISLINLNYTIGVNPMIKNGKEQLSVAKKVNEAIKNRRMSYKDDYTIFVMGRGLYIYEYLDKLPNVEYFYIPVIEPKDYEEPYIETLNYIINKKAEIVVLDLTTLQAKYFYNKNLTNILDNNYRVLGSYYDRVILEAK